MALTLCIRTIRFLAKNRTNFVKATARVALITSALASTIFGAFSHAEDTQIQKSVTAQAQSKTVYLAEGDQDERPLALAKSNFGCSEKIFAVAELNHYPRGKHDFSVRWIDPAGTVREHTQYPFYINTDDVRLWSWLSLRRGAGGSMLQWLDPSAGLEEFIGPWRVEVHIDAEKIASLKMEVNC